MYIKLGTIRANRLYDDPNDYMILSEVPSSGMSFESPTKIRSIAELNIWFGKDYPEYSYLCELLGLGVTLWIYGPVSPQSKAAIDLSGYSDSYLDQDKEISYPSVDILEEILGKDSPREEIIFHISGEPWVWYDNIWVRVSDLPQNISPQSVSLLNRDTLVVSVSEDSEVPIYCSPKYRAEEETEEGYFEEGIETPSENMDISWTEGEGTYSSYLRWDGNPLGSGYLGFKTSSQNWIMCYSSIGLQELKRTFGNSVTYRKISDIDGLVSVLEENYASCEKLDSKTWLLRSQDKRDVINFINYPGITVEEAAEDNEILAYSKILRSGCGYIQFWSRTIGQDKNQYDLEESKIKVRIENVGFEGWLIEFSRYGYVESYVGNLKSTIEKAGIIDRINRSSRLVRCNLEGDTLREGSWYLSGATPIEPTAEWYRNSMRMLLGTLEDSVCPDFFMIPDLSLYGERSDEQLFLPYATAGEFQFLIHENTEEEYIKNYLADKENRLLYFFGDIYCDEDFRPGYYVYLKNILLNDPKWVARDIVYKTRINQRTEFGNVHNPYITEDDLDLWKCNYLVCNNQAYYHSKYQNGGDDYITSGTLRFIIGKIYREIQKHRWKVIGQKFNALMENKINQILQRPSEFSHVRSIKITDFTTYPELNLLDIEVEVYTRELLKNNITLDITINYKKD